MTDSAELRMAPAEVVEATKQLERWPIGWRS
jgi:hypothetical protein